MPLLIDPNPQQTSVWTIFNKIADTDPLKAKMMKELKMEPMPPVRIG